MKRSSSDPRLREVDMYQRLLAMRGCYLNESSKILDFGCGAGRLVYLFRDAGFDAHGFDLNDYLALRSPDDRRLFATAKQSGDTSDMSFDWSKYRLPYDSGTFDFVVSSQVMEHVLDHEAVTREIARVLKPEGIAVHTFPGRYFLIEPHMYVPLGGHIKSHAYYLFWALMGIRNEHQKGLSARETARLNTLYARTGLSYPPTRGLIAMGRKYFHVSKAAPEAWLVAWNALDFRMARVLRPLMTLGKMVVWVLERPRVTS
jgi:SAM-dependent methyltransferase